MVALPAEGDSAGSACPASVSLKHMTPRATPRPSLQTEASARALYTPRRTFCFQALSAYFSTEFTDRESEKCELDVRPVHAFLHDLRLL